MCERYRQRSGIDSGSHVGPITSEHMNAGTPSDTAPGRRVGGTLRVSPFACVKSDTRPQRKIVSHRVHGALLYIIPFHLSLPFSSYTWFIYLHSPPCPQAARKACLTVPQQQKQTLAQLHHNPLTFASSGPPATTTAPHCAQGCWLAERRVPDYRCQHFHR